MHYHRDMTRTLAVVGVQDLADSIARRLAELGWNQAELVRQSGVSAYTVRKMMAGEEVGYRVDVKRKIAVALGWTPDSLDRTLRGDEPMVAKLPAGFAAKLSLDISDLPASDQAIVTAMVERLRQQREGS